MTTALLQAGNSTTFLDCYDAVVIDKKLPQFLIQVMLKYPKSPFLLSTFHPDGATTLCFLLGPFQSPAFASD